MSNPSSAQPGEPDQEAKPESFYRRGHWGYVWGFWISAAIAAPVLVATVVLLVLALVGVVPWRLLSLAILGAMATGLAAWFRTEDGTGSDGHSDVVQYLG